LLKFHQNNFSRQYLEFIFDEKFEANIIKENDNKLGFENSNKIIIIIIQDIQKGRKSSFLTIEINHE